MGTDRLFVPSPGNWFVAAHRSKEGLQLSFGGPAEFVGRTPGEIHGPLPRRLKWYANPGLDAAHVVAVRDTPLGHRIVSMDIGRTTISRKLLQAVSSLSPNLRDIAFTQCRGTVESISQPWSMRFRSFVFDETDPRIVGPLPFFATSLMLGALDQLPDAYVLHAANALPQNLFIRGPASASSLAYALKCTEIRRVDVWDVVDAPALLDALLEPQSTQPPNMRRRIFHVRGDIQGRRADLTARLAREGIAVELTRPPKRVS